MKNKIINYEFLESDNYEYRDYTSRDYLIIYDMEELNDDYYIEYVQIQDNDKIERISYQIYGTADYWDLLILINSRDPLFDMVYSYDMVENSVYSDLDEYDNTNFNSKLSTLTINNEIYLDTLKEGFLNKAIEANEDLRTLKIIKPSKLQEFLKIARDKGYI